MPDFEKLEHEMQQTAEEHPEQVDEAISKAEQQADQRVGEGHASQVQEAGSELEKELGVQQAPQPPEQQ